LNRLCGCPERVAEIPAAMVEPRPGVWQSHGLKAEKVANRALGTDRGGMQPAKRGKTALRTFVGDDRDLARRFIENGHVDRALISP
jgi:hypothetical protein